MSKKTPASGIDRDDLLAMLKDRFAQNMNRHKGIDWSDVEAKLKGKQAAIRALGWMEESGGEPDVVVFDKKSGEIIFVDCAAESPKGRRSLCYDQEALNARKEHKPSGSAVGIAESVGVDLLTEAQYRHLQTLGEFDLKTSSWIKTPENVRLLGGAIFCDRRFDTVFTYHNGAESYYAARGFRCALKL